MVRPNFQLTDDNVADVIAICVRLDGMPLAIELAAARTKLLAPHAILSRLDRSLELGGAELDRPSRQRTLRQTIAWSFDLLTADQQGFFRQLGVFGGSCDLDAVAAVTETSADPLDEVAGLVDMSLVRILEDRDGEPELIFFRPYGHSPANASRLPVNGNQRPESMPSTTSPSLQSSLLGCEPRNISQLVTGSNRSWRIFAPLWSGAFQKDPDRGDANVGFRLCQELTWFWYACGYPQEGRRWLERATERISGEGPEEIAVLHGLGVILLQQGDSEKARELLSRCLDYWRGQGDDSQTAKELNSLAVAYRNTDDHDQARALFDRRHISSRTKRRYKSPGGSTVQFGDPRN